MRLVMGLVRFMSPDRRIAVVQTPHDGYAVVDVQSGRLPAVGEALLGAVSEPAAAQAPTPAGLLPLVVVVHGAGLTMSQVQELFGPLIW